ncbi:MAG: ABC transporter substrate-binding protein [Nitrosopumilus sp.]
MKNQFKIIIVVISIIIVGSGIYSILQTDVNLQKTSKIDHKELGIKSATGFELYQNDEEIILVDGADRRVSFSSELKNNSVTTPVNRIIVFSSTHAAFIDRLGVSEKIVGVAWGGTYDWYIDSIKERLKDGSIKDVGLSSNPNYDEIIALEPDLVLLSGGTGLWEEHGKKFDDLGISYIVISEWMEEDPLGQFEWIKAFSIITGKEKEAFEIFDQVNLKTAEIYSLVADSQKPKVLWAGIYKGTAYIPKENSYVGKTIRLANADYVLGDISNNSQISVEELLVRGKNADILVYSSDLINNVNDITSVNPLLAELGPIKNCNVFSYQPWHWQSIDKYDDYANDVAAIMHPDVFPDYQLKQFKKISCV